MGTSTMGGDLHSDKQDKLLKLQARKKELELMLAAKNEELYKLCVREVRLTGVVPPEAPLERRPRVLRRPDTGSNFFPSPPRERPDTFSLRSARPAPEPPRRPPARPLAPPHAHFSSSHPDLAHCAPAPPAPQAPLLYQYAAQLRAHSQHLRAQPARRGALQRTQTYHLTAHSDYMPHEPPQPPQPPRTLPLRVATDDADALSVTRFSPLSPLSPPTPLSPLTPPDGRPKEKQWYETSLDAPPRADSALRKSASLKRAPGAAAAQPYELMVSAGRQAALRSPAARSPESPANVTVIEQGKCIPYREETKPFEMSDFYKYSTKFRQASAAAPRPAHPAPPAHPAAPYDRLPPFSPDHWRGYAN